MPTPFESGIQAWVRLLRLSGFQIEERLNEGVVEYRLVIDEAQGGLTPPPRSHLREADGG